MIVERPTIDVHSGHFVETESGVGDIDHFRVGMVDYLVIGLEDGSLHLYNHSKNYGTCFSLKGLVGKEKSL